MGRIKMSATVLGKIMSGQYDWFDDTQFKIDALAELGIANHPMAELAYRTAQHCDPFMRHGFKINYYIIWSMLWTLAELMGGGLE